MNIFKIIYLAAFFFIADWSFSQDQTSIYKETYRPQFHFSPAKNWTNDPNGLLFYNNQYHLFYQSNPFANVWGHMSWSHAISNDLIHWKPLPIAIKEENGVMIFSGTCVADVNNSSGFGANGKVPLVAIYTGSTDSLQTQNIAYSLDDGITWTKYKSNPILDLHKKDFRDPKVFWCDEKKYWVMILMLSTEHKVQFYRSKNLLNWKFLSEFGPAGDTSGVWECPDLFKVFDRTNTYHKWTLTMSVNGSMQYFVGSFDGIKFKNENDPKKIFRLDYGPDYYAAISYNNIPATQMPVMMGWVNNWSYANDIPTSPWKGAMSLPRYITFKKYDNDFILLQQPIEKIDSLDSDFYILGQESLTNKETQLNIKSSQFEADIVLQPSSKAIAGIKIAVGENHFAEIGYDAARNILYLDRSHCANQNFNANFEKMNYFETQLQPQNNFIKLKIFYDNSIIEVFANNGEKVMTAQIFPNANDNGIVLFSKNGNCVFPFGTILKIKSIWQ